MAYIARAHLQAQSVPFLSCLSWVYHNNALPVGIGDLLDMPGISSGGGTSVDCCFEVFPFSQGWGLCAY